MNTPQRWSALAPDFAEVEENVEYIEREDEFDIHPISVIHKRRLDLEDEDVDVLTIEPLKAPGEFTGENGQQAVDPSNQVDGSDAVGDGTFTMPVLLDLSESESEEIIVAVGPGTMRRKSPGEGREWMNGQGVGSGDEKGAGKKPTANGVSKRSRKRKAD